MQALSSYFARQIKFTYQKMLEIWRNIDIIPCHVLIYISNGIHIYDSFAAEGLPLKVME